MIVDPTALLDAAVSIDGLTVGIHEPVSVVREAVVQSKRTAEELDAIREELRIHREVRRR